MSFHVADMKTLRTALAALRSSGVELEDPGDEIGDYCVRRLINTGAMGRVYVADHLATGERVAIKHASAAFLAAPDGRARFRAEFLRVHVD